MISPPLLRWGLAAAALGLAFLGALLVIGARPTGWGLIALGLPLSGVFALAGDALGRNFGPVLGERFHALLAYMRPWMWWMALYAALKIPVPLWPAGFPVLGLASTAALFVAAFLYVCEKENARVAALLAALAFGLGLAAEVLGSRSGFPFGAYTYAPAPLPKVLGVPLIVPLGWFALTLAGTLLSGGRAWLAGLLLALWDVGLEPLMTAQGYWRWNDPHPLWAGAPLQNFLGWWAVAALISWLFTRQAPGLFAASVRGRSPVPSFALAYPIETFFLPGGLVLVGRLPEAAVTLLSMLTGLALAARRRR